jgi:hypothetical protein
MIQCAAAGGIKSKPISLASITAFFVCALLKINFQLLDYFHDPVRYRGREQIKTYLTGVRSRLFFVCALLKINFQLLDYFHDPVRCRGREQIKTYLTEFDHGFFCLCAYENEFSTAGLFS